MSRQIKIIIFIAIFISIIFCLSTNNIFYYKKSEKIIAGATTLFPYQLGTGTPTNGYILTSTGTDSKAQWTNNLSLGSGIITAGSFVFEKGTYDLTLASAAITGISKTITFPNASGTVLVGGGGINNILYMASANAVAGSGGLTYSPSIQALLVGDNAWGDYVTLGSGGGETGASASFTSYASGNEYSLYINKDDGAGGYFSLYGTDGSNEWNIDSTGYAVFNGIGMPSDQRIFFGGLSGIGWETTGNDNLQIGTAVNSATSSGYFSLMEYNDLGNANRSPLAVSANPVFRIYSSDVAQALDYIEFYHDQTNAVIGIGNGALNYTLGVANTDLIFNFIGTTNSGQFKWMEDEDYFQFNDDVLFPDNEQLILGTGSDFKFTHNGTNSTIENLTGLLQIVGSGSGINIGTDGEPTTFNGDIIIGNQKIKQNSILQQYTGSKTLTDGSATGFVDIAVATGEIVGGTIHYTIEVKDGTDYQVHTGSITFAAVNKGGTVSSDIDEVYLAASETLVATAGTLTDAFTITDGTGKITINLNANTSLTASAGYPKLKYEIHLHSPNLITPL